MTKSASELVAEAMQARQDPARDDTAIPLLERAIELEPSRGDAYLALANIYNQRGWLQRELALWLGRFDLEPNDPDACERIGWVLWFMGRARGRSPAATRTHCPGRTSPSGSTAAG